MQIIRKIYKYIFSKEYRFKANSKLGMYKNMSDKEYLKKIFKLTMKRDLNIEDPKTFNEKIQWLKLYDRKDIYTNMVDKFESKQIVSKMIGEEYIIPTIGVYNNFDEIDFEKLPNQFVIKCTHDSGGVVICKNKEIFNINKARKKINKCLRKNFYYTTREWPYKNVKPRIIIEKYMENIGEDELIDYKFMCFNGEPKCIFTCSERMKNNLKVTFFDLNWNKMPFERHYPSSDKKISKPKNFDVMLELAKKLSENTKFLRVDFYEINNKVYFGELTLYPGSGLEEFSPEEWDYKLGEMINLN